MYICMYVCIYKYKYICIYIYIYIHTYIAHTGKANPPCWRTRMPRSPRQRKTEAENPTGDCDEMPTLRPNPKQWDERVSRAKECSFNVGQGTGRAGQLNSM